MRERRNHLILVSLIVAALIGVGLIAIPGSPFHKGTTLGLDLQGGLEVVLQAVPPKGHTLTDEDLDRSVDIMRNRIDKLGVAEPEIRKQGDDQIVIQLAGVTDPEKAAELIGKTAQLELYDLEQDLIGPSTGAQGAVATSRLFDLLGGKGGSAPENASAYYLFNKNGRLLEGPANTREALFTRKNPRVPRRRQSARRRERRRRRLVRGQRGAALSAEPDHGRAVLLPLPLPAGQRRRTRCPR